MTKNSFGSYDIEQHTRGRKYGEFRGYHPKWKRTAAETNLSKDEAIDLLVAKEIDNLKRSRASAPASPQLSSSNICRTHGTPQIMFSDFRSIVTAMPSGSATKAAFPDALRGRDHPGLLRRHGA
jgi:hypothetical protein